MTEAATRKQKVRYRYDALGRRVSRGLGYGKEQTKFTYDGQDVLVDDNFGTQTKYLNGEGIDNKLRATTGSTTSYFLADHLGSTNGLANSSGVLTASNSYDSFGNPTNTNFSSRYQFTGRESDNFSGLQFSRARFYDPNLGRFISEDPIGFDGGDVNLYVYVKNNPARYTDPFGLLDPIVYQDPNIYPTDPEEIARTQRCYKKYKFSAMASGGDPSVEAALEYLEIGSLSSLALDGAAAGRKYFGPKTASPNPYASGINMVTKDVNRALGFPKIFGSPLGKYLSPIGTKLSPVLAVTGAGTLAYNVTTDIQCLCGVID
ncbi:MAG: RHS repeat-associated core domain-containing protein [Pyrinomonadaceae bacterium]